MIRECQWNNEEWEASFGVGGAITQLPQVGVIPSPSGGYAKPSWGAVFHNNLGIPGFSPAPGCIRGDIDEDPPFS
jgi:hypothetical protein